MTAYIVAGTQAAPGKQNHIIVMKMSQLDKATSNDEESELWVTYKMIKNYYKYYNSITA